MYLVHNEKYNKAMTYGVSSNMGMIQHEDLYCSFILMEDFDLSISTLYEIDDESQGEHALRLERKYLHVRDIDNLKHILKPKISNNDPDLKQTLAKYSIF